MKVTKRNKTIEDFDIEKIARAINKAGMGIDDARMIAKNVSDLFIEDTNVAVDDIHDAVEAELVSMNQTDVVKQYIIYRAKHKKIRKIIDDQNSKLIQNYLDSGSWDVKDNANTTYSLSGLHNYITTEASRRFWFDKIYSRQSKQAHESGDLYISDLGLLSNYCAGHDLTDLLTVGFRGAPGKTNSKPAKHFGTALNQIVNYIFTLSGEAAGAQAFSNVDTLLAPYIRYDGLSYEQVKQALQEFVYNLNVSTRTGFQCVDEETEILTGSGWASYKDVHIGDIIKTFNLTTGSIEDLPVEYVHTSHYSGVMYNLKNRIQDQLITPKHRVVRRIFNTDKYTLEPVEKVLDYKSPVHVPIAACSSNTGTFDKNIIKLVAWLISDGSLEKKGSFRRVRLTKSQEAYPEQFETERAVIEALGLSYSLVGSQGIGLPCTHFRFNSETSKEILSWFDYDSIKEIPNWVLALDVEHSRCFLDAYMTEGDGSITENKLYTTSLTLVDQLQQVCVNCGYGFTTSNKGPTPIGNKDVYVIRVIKHTDTFITDISEVAYDGIIWCPHTRNETIIARRKGKVFITGNTPFSNITLDLTCPEHLKSQAVAIGGEFTEDSYGDFEQEIKMFNRAFCEVMSEGDAEGRVMTFPIPTYNVTSEFDFDDPEYDALWEMTAKYGIPYFANMVSGDIKPEDIRSMCCRMSLNLQQLSYKGGGLFGAGSLTGSTGVVTINLPRLGYLSKDQKDFYKRLDKLLEIAYDTLERKREFIEEQTERGLYPYTKYYLRNIKERTGKYWINHFSTLGIIGANECCLNMFGEDITAPASREFVLELMDYLREKLIEFQERSGSNWNLEATPAESVTSRLARLDSSTFKDCHYQGTLENPYYTNSTALPVNFTEDLFEYLDHQDEFQTKYTGGTVAHLFLGEQIPPESAKELVRTVCYNYKLPYISITPTFSVCPEHGYIAGEHAECPTCNAKTEVYSRIVGYLRPINNWNASKEQEFRERKTFHV